LAIGRKVPFKGRSRLRPNARGVVELGRGGVWRNLVQEEARAQMPLKQAGGVRAEGWAGGVQERPECLYNRPRSAHNAVNASITLENDRTHRSAQPRGQSGNAGTPVWGGGWGVWGGVWEVARSVTRAAVRHRRFANMMGTRESACVMKGVVMRRWWRCMRCVR